MATRREKGCWWARDRAAPDSPALRRRRDVRCRDHRRRLHRVSAALHLAEAGATSTVLEAEDPGWGASGRNGGFCCLGGRDGQRHGADRRFGSGGRRRFRQAAGGRDRHSWPTCSSATGIDADRHSEGETLMAHRPAAMDALRDEAGEVRADYGVTPQLIEPRCAAPSTAWRARSTARCTIPWVLR